MNIWIVSCIVDLPLHMLHGALGRLGRTVTVKLRVALNFMSGEADGKSSRRVFEPQHWYLQGYQG